MTRKEHLLTILAEECAEIAKCASKALRFGLHDKEPGQEFINADRISQEYGDLLGVYKLLVRDGYVKNPVAGAVQAKIDKVTAFLKVSKTCGTLESEDEPLPLVVRFQRHRWSDARRQMDAMKNGETLTLPMAEFFNVSASRARLNDAYQGTRSWTISRKGGILTINCSKPHSSHPSHSYEKHMAKTLRKPARLAPPKPLPGVRSVHPQNPGTLARA